MVGKNGLTDAVLAEIDVSLTSHELIKISIRGVNKNEFIIYVGKYNKN